jgi:small subunit ribosomal protein S5
MDTEKTTNVKVEEGTAPKTTSYQRGARSPRSGDRRKSSLRPEKPEFDQKILSIRRVTRVVSGGRRFSFSVAMIIGDKKGSVGLGLGKSSDTTLAINKAVASARKHMFRIETTKEMSLSHAVEGKFKASRVMIMPNKGKGLVVGGALRDIMILGGLKNVTGKILSRSKTHLNNAKAAVIALQTLKKARVPKSKE